MYLNENFIELIKSIWAGVAIAIGTLLFLLVGGVWGAIFFTIGLYMVLWFKLNLYTGKIGYIKRMSNIPKIILILIGNCIGCCIMFAFSPAAAGAIVATKLATPLLVVLVKSIICGILIYVAVEQYKNGKEYAPLIAVPAFILCGAEHSIADICFIIAAGAFTWQSAIFLGVVAIGNAIGSLLFKLSLDFKKKY